MLLDLCVQKRKRPVSDHWPAAWMTHRSHQASMTSPIRHQRSCDCGSVTCLGGTRLADISSRWMFGSSCLRDSSLDLRESSVGRESSDDHTIPPVGILQRDPTEIAVEILQRIPTEQERWELLCFHRVDNRKQLAKACNEEVSCAQVD